MDRVRFWDTLSRQLENKGPEYAARCTLGNSPSNAGDSSIPPASFHTLSIEEVQETTPLVKVCEEDLKNVSVQFCPEVSIGVNILTLGCVDSLYACVCPCVSFHGTLTHLYSNKPGEICPSVPGNFTRCGAM